MYSSFIIFDKFLNEWAILVQNFFSHVWNIMENCFIFHLSRYELHRSYSMMHVKQILQINVIIFFRVTGKIQLRSKWVEITGTLTWISFQPTASSIDCLQSLVLVRDKRADIIIHTSVRCKGSNDNNLQVFHVNLCLFSPLFCLSSTLETTVLTVYIFHGAHNFPTCDLNNYFFQLTLSWIVNNINDDNFFIGKTLLKTHDNIAFTM